VTAKVTILSPQAEHTLQHSLFTYPTVIKQNYFLEIWPRAEGQDSSVGIATCYGLDGPGIESRWGRDFYTRPHRPWGPLSLLVNEYRVFPGGKAAGAWP